MANTIEIVFNATDNVSRTADGIIGKLGGIGRAASGVATAALTAVAGAGLLAAGGMTAVGVAGLGMNAQIENVTAQLNAFTKDGEKSAEILDMIRDRAARTPFEFGEMASAAAGLLPAANASGQGLEYLIEQAEILAASNPAQGLSGAAFALREAVSGDFASIIERFNLPRSYINELREEGVPNLEIVSRAMQQMGFDTELVTNLSQTAQGRWSTLKDTFTNLASTITQPIFDRFSAGLGTLNDWISRNEPMLTTLANTIAERVGGAVETVIGIVSRFVGAIQAGLPVMNALTAAFVRVLPEPLAARLIAFRDDILPRLAAAFNTYIVPVVQWVTSNGAQLLDWAIGLGVAFASLQVISTVGGMIAGVVGAFGALSAAISASGGIVAGIVALLGGPLTLIIAGIVAAVGLLTVAWRQNWGDIQGKTAAVVEWLRANIPPVIDAMRATVEGILDRLRQFWETHGETILATAERIWGLIRDYIAGIFETITLVFSAFKLAFEGDWRGFGETLRLAWETLWRTIRTFLAGVWEMLRPVLETLVKRFMQTVTSWIDSVKRVFTETDWGAVGLAIIQGIAAGITNGVSAIVTAAQNAARAALDAAKGFLGIDSPSKEFMKLGAFSAEGFAVGLQTSKLPTMGGASVARGALDGARTAAAPSSPANNVTINVTSDTQAAIVAQRIARDKRSARWGLQL